MSAGRAATWGALAVMLGGLLAAPASADRGPRLEDSFMMHGTITFARNVYGEHRGQHVTRSWTFRPHCATGSCRLVTLLRRRSGRKLPDSVVLRRRGPNLYRGRGRFWVPLLCAGHVVRHGGLAFETITVRITRTARVGAGLLVTGVRALYDNPTRINMTRCPGGIGRDAARYTGTRTTPLPGPPTAAFTAAPDLVGLSATFTDESRPGSGGPPLVAWSWNYGDPDSGAANTSTERSPTHRFSAPGIYTVTLTVTDGYGRKATATTRILV